MADPSTTTTAAAIVSKLGAIPLLGGAVYYFYKPRTLKDFLWAFVGSAVALVTVGPLVIQSVYHYMPFLMNLGLITEISIQSAVAVVAFALFENLGRLTKQIAQDPAGFITKILKR